MNNVETVSNKLIKKIEDDILKITYVLNLEFNSLNSYFNRLSKKKKDEVMEITINKLLNELKDKLTFDKYQEITRRVDEVTDYYANNKEDFDVILEEGDKVANDLLFKVIGVNKRRIELPIKVETIKSYCLSSDIKEDKVYDALLWIIIRYITIIECLNK